MLVLFWFVSLVFLQVYGHGEDCNPQDNDRLFECQLVVTESFSTGRGIESTAKLIKDLKEITHEDYGKQKCINFWRMTLCTRTLKPCSQNVPNSLIEELKDTIERTFGVCNGLDANATKELVKCNSFVQGGTCSQHLERPCDPSYFDCLYHYVDRECVELNRDGRQLLCYLVGWQTKEVCLYHSICTQEKWTKEVHYHY
ncbi:unnamed protein product [Bursaphelenchus xylophilus]|uniref:(pine wood nematode) hypothetical protein n=1 Tax=Bursaphelenchus xylophilus TaxID=6326 RepID=A0A1I7S7V1_BURXY|nr:unnamed protein product [Bursaphelenchus xylophilus]CAG9087053.1 unnamed protein product [Bursaphelenchus xylophilus]